eukprot:GGOE01019622.1.p1 GENE.GGOE01019622.1~~GGOE01019622.1.p1  ORF type:complete len:963 (-),score=222.34 GGOE01019622.1:30-2918(-)
MCLRRCPHFFSKVPAGDEARLGNWIVQIPLLEARRFVISQKERTHNSSLCLLVLSDLTILVTTEPSEDAGVMQSMADANNSLIAAVGKEMGQQGVLMGKGQDFTFYWKDTLGEVWEVQGMRLGPIWYVLITPYSHRIQAYFNPSAAFTVMSKRFCAIQYATWATFAFVMSAASVFYLANALYYPQLCVRILSHVLMLLAIGSLLILFIFLNVYLELFNTHSGPTMIITSCASALVAAASDQLRWEAVQTTTVVAMMIEVSALLNMLIAAAVDIGKLRIGTLDFQPADRPRLLAYQWLYSKMFPEVQAVFGGGWLVYSGYVQGANNTLVWLNSTNWLTSDKGCVFEMGALAATTAQYFLTDPLTHQPSGSPVWQNKNFWLYEQPWWLVPLQMGPNATVATINPVIDPNGDMALTYSRLILTSDWDLFVTAVNMSFQFLQQVLFESSANASGTIYLMSNRTKQLIATSVPINMARNGHGLYADEWISAAPEIQSSYTQLLAGGHLQRNESVVFTYEDDRQLFCCSMIPLANMLQGDVLGVDLITVSVASYDGMHSGVTQLKNRVEGISRNVALWRSLFLVSGILALLSFPLAYGTLLGWIDWQRWRRRRAPALVTKMVLELPPIPKAMGQLPLGPGTTSLVDFCLGLTHYKRCTPPSRRAVRSMLARSFACLRREEAVDFIESCGLSHDEALAISLYTCELGERFPMAHLFPGEAAEFQLYLELNRALQTDDPDLLQYWQPLLHPLLAGLQKVQGNSYASLRALSQPAVTLSLRAYLQAWVAHLFCGAPAPVSRNLEAGPSVTSSLHKPILFKAMLGPAASLQPGDTLSWSGLSSWTSSRTVAQVAGQTAGVVGLLFLECSAWCRIGALSHAPNEEEVVLLPEATFVVGVTGCDSFDLYTDNIRFVELLDDRPLAASTASCSAKVADDASAESPPSHNGQYAGGSLRSLAEQPCGSQQKLCPKG